MAASQIVQNQTQTGTEVAVAPGQGFWGWIGNCFGYRTAEPYQGQYIAPPAVITDGTVQQPTPYQPYQGDYGYNNGYGYGCPRCVGW